jgi:hypothetical protein
MQALRDNNDKPDLHYLHTWYHALCEVCMVCQAGAKKYARGNYLKGQPHSQLLACAERHIGKFGNYKEDDYDVGPGGTDRHHIALAIWNLLQLLENELDPSAKAKWDDRLRIPDEPKKEEERNIPFGSRSEDCLEIISRQGEFYIRDNKDTVPEKEKCVHPGLSTPQQHHCGSEGTVCGTGSGEASARKGTES